MSNCYQSQLSRLKVKVKCYQKLSSFRVRHNVLFTCCISSWSVGLILCADKNWQTTVTRTDAVNTNGGYYRKLLKEVRDWRYFTNYNSTNIIRAFIYAVASLGLVSPGSATGSTRHFFRTKPHDDLFSHHRLSVLQCHPYLFSSAKLTTFFAHHSLLLILLGCHPPPPGGSHSAFFTSPTSFVHYSL